MKSHRWLFFSIAILVVLVVAGLASSPAQAMPMFARRLGVPCTTCHTTIPRLNEVGYKFRAAGFRMPEEIGKSSEAKFDLGDFFSARIQARYDYQATNQPNGAPVFNRIPAGQPGAGSPGPRTKTNSFNFAEATLYPLTGSFGKYFGSLSELSFAPEDFWEVENAYVRVVMGNSKNFFTSRIGIFHPWEGYGASDRPFSNARPLFQTTPISGAGTGVPYTFQPWGLDEVGLEVGADFNKLSVRTAIIGGNFMRWDSDANQFLAFPSQTGPWKGANQAVAALGKPYNYVAHSTPDFSANVTYLLNAEGGGLTFLYYRGNMATPTHCVGGTPIGSLENGGAGPVCGVSGSTAANPFGAVGDTNFDFSAAGGAFRDNFNRIAFYGSYPFKKFDPMAGFQWGNDDNPYSAGTKVTTYDDKGYFLEGAYAINPHVTAGFRYDWFHPNETKLNTQWAVTPYVNIPLLNGLQVIAEYQHRDFEYNVGTVIHHRQNDTFQARFIFIK